MEAFNITLSGQVLNIKKLADKMYIVRAGSNNMATLVEVGGKWISDKLAEPFCRKIADKIVAHS